jgi:hypothetical protein
MSAQPKFCEGARMGFNCTAGGSAEDDGIIHHIHCPAGAAMQREHVTRAPEADEHGGEP